MYLLKEEQVRPRLFAGVLVALVLVVAFSESLDLGDDDLAGLGAEAR